MRFKHSVSLLVVPWMLAAPVAEATPVVLAPAAAPGGAADLTPVADAGDYSSCQGMDFDTARAPMPLYRDYVFGGAARAGAKATVIRNTQELARHFRPFEDFTGRISLNSELQRYQDFNPKNFVFKPDQLVLQATLDETKGYAGGYNTRVYATSGPPGVVLDSKTANPLSALGWPDTRGVSVGTMVAFQYAGLYRVIAVSDQGVTFKPMSDSPSRVVVGNLNAILPYVGGWAAESSSGSVVTLQDLPVGLKVGMAAGTLNGLTDFERNDDSRVTAIDTATKTVTISPPVKPVGQGHSVIFGPPINSAQIWSQDFIDLTGKVRAWAIDFNIVLPSDGIDGRNTAGINTLPAFKAVPPSFPWGAWPALWLYSANDGATWSDPSEIDILEMLYSTTTGTHWWSGNNVPNKKPGHTLFIKKTGDWYSGGGGGIAKRSGPIVGEHRMSIIVTPSKTCRYLDGDLVKEDDYFWTSPHQSQIGVNLAVGSISRPLSANFNFPMAASNFANMNFGLKEIKIYKMR